MKRAFIILLTAALLLTPAAAAEFDTDNEDVDASVFLEGDIAVSVEDIEISAPSAILIEKETGEVLYEKAADTQRMPASVTKVMSMLLIAEAVDRGDISFEDIVTVSTRAANMGGSQVYLEEGERMTLKEMLKCIVVSSANDATVAVAEHICGSEEVFVARMNQRAQELGMVNTHFTNSTGLFDDTTHVTTARDIAIMSRELLGHEWITEYTTIWMDTIRDGAFGLSNTNKLIYYYEGATGLKTGFTRAAGYCLSASARRDGVEYIAVVMGCETTGDRFESAKTLLSFAFANYAAIPAQPDAVLPVIKVNLGDKDFIQPVLESEEWVLTKKSEAASMTKTVELIKEMTAPVSPGQQLGRLIVKNGAGEVVKEIKLMAADEVRRLSLGDIFLSFLSAFFTGWG